MESLFGVPIDTLMAVLLVAFVAVTGVVAALALRNRVLLRLAIRNIPRRRGRTALIIFGLMLGTAIISAAFSTGDTMTHTIRSSALTSLGHIDEVISVRGAETGPNLFVEAPANIRYFDESLYAAVRDALSGSELVDGLAPAIMEPVAVQDLTSRQTEPRVTIFAIDPARMAGFGEIKQSDGTVSLADLAPGEAYLNKEAAEELKASPSDQLSVFTAGGLASLRVKGIVAYDGAGTDESAMLMPLRAAQELLGKEGQVEHIIVSNKGGTLSGVKHTDAVIKALEPTLGPLGLEADPTKKDALELANQAGNGFTTFFVTFGTFSIVAGILLIFLIFVMLAAERKSEMGIARAVGTERGHLVQMFAFEGMVYDLVAAAIGALLGLAVAFGMVFLMANAFAAFGVEIKLDFRPRSLIVAYTLGVLLTFTVVTASAWRVSALNIVAAIRNLPEAAIRRGGRASRILGFAAILLGFFMTVGGLNAAQAAPFSLGISFMVIGLVPLLRALGVPDRAAYSFPGLALMVWWLLPLDMFDFILPEFSTDFSIFIIAGLMVVIGATWTVMYNSDLLLRGIMAVSGRFSRLRPMMKTAISYPLANRFRTGMTLAMFTLIVFTLVVMATITTAFTNAFNNKELFGGGFDIRSTTAPLNPVGDMRNALGQAQGLDPESFEVVASQSRLLLEAKQVDAQGREFESYPVRGADDTFLRSTTYSFATIAEGYDSPQAVWQALASDPSLAVVDPLPVSRRANWSFVAAMPDFKLQGFYLEDESFSPVPVEVRDPQTGTTLRLTIIGVLAETVPAFMAGITTSQGTVADAYGPLALPTVHYYKLRDDTDARDVAEALESAFLTNGMEADSLEEELEKAVVTSLTFNYILQGFMGLGLVVGVAALGVISARSVVERRQEIGVMRSIGFERRMVQLSFLLESSFVALLGIALGTLLGLVTAFNVIRDASQSASWENMGFAVPWLNLFIILLLVYLAAMLTTFLPARQASRVYPAEALRYQ